MKKLKAKQIWKPVGIYLGIVLVFYGLLVIGFSVPNGRIIDNVRADLWAGQYAENYPTNGFGGQQDGWGDCITLSLGVEPVGQETSPFLRAITIPRGPDCSKTGDYFNAMWNGENHLAQQDYARYWGGGSVLTRIGLAAGGVAGARVLGSLFLLSAVASLLLIAQRYKVLLPVGVLVVVYAGTSDFFGIFPQLVHVQALAAAFIGGALVLWASYRNLSTLFYASFFAGAFYEFIDLFTNPPLAFMLTIFCAGLALVGQGNFVALVKQVVWAGIAWILGYALVWAGHWILAFPVFGVQYTLRKVLREMNFGFNAELADGSTTVSEVGFAGAVDANFNYWLTHTPALKYVLLCAVIATIGCIAYGWWQHKSLLPLAMLAILVVIPVWLAVVPGHSQIHYWFTYRMFAMGFAVFCATVAALLLPYSVKTKLRRNNSESVIDGQ